MKIVVIGTKMMPKIINKMMIQLPNVEIQYHCSEFYDEAASIADALQKEGSADAILFSGPTSYHYAKKRVVSTIPWTYLPYSRVAAFQACLEGIAIFQSNLKALSVDQFDHNLLREALEEVGIRDSVILRAGIDSEEEQFEKKLLDFHRNCYRQGRVSLCVTSMEHIAEPLRREGIPCVRIYPVKEVLQEQIYHLQILHMSAKKNQGQTAVVAIQLDYVSFDEQNLMFQEWGQMQCQNEYRKKVYALAQRMEAAVFSGGGNHFFLVTSRNSLINVFLKDSTYWEFCQLGRRFPDNTVCMGIGIGNTTLEAKSRAMMALNRSVSEHSGKSYMIEDENQTIELTFPGENPSPLPSLSFLAQRLHLSTSALKRLSEVLEDCGKEIDAATLAEKLGISARSANRILAHLEKEGYAAVVGKQSAGKGRPSRILRIELPFLSPPS